MCTYMYSLLVCYKYPLYSRIHLNTFFSRFVHHTGEEGNYNAEPPGYRKPRRRLLQF